MKVLHVIPAVAPRYGGPSKAIFEMCTSLKSAGCEAVVCTTDADGQAELPVDLGSPLDYQGVKTIFFHRRFSEAFKYSRTMSQWLSANVSRFDVVHIHAVFSHSSLAAARACRANNVPYIVRPLGTLDPWGMRQKPLRKQLFMKFGVDSMLRNAAAIHYTTSDEKNAVEQTLGYGKGTIVPLGIDLTAFSASKTLDEDYAKARPGGKGPYILVMSRLHHKKGLELLFQCFSELTKESGLGDWQLVIAGDGDRDYVDSLKRLAEAVGGKDSIIFLGWLGGDEKIAALKGASMLALPSYQENFGVCIIEALACGVPVFISPHVNLAPDIIEAGAGWVVALDKASLQDGLRTAMQNERERIDRGRSGRRLAQQFSASEIALRLLALYNSVTQHSSTAPRPSIQVRTA
jgi:glycosyltransferase involved in cell wall biosynthesis